MQKKTHRDPTCDVSKSIGSLPSTMTLYLLAAGAPNDRILQANEKEELNLVDNANIMALECICVVHLIIHQTRESACVFITGNHNVIKREKNTQDLQV